jgi:hypothetical protein
MILYDLCLLPAQFRYVIVYIGQVESRGQIADQCTPWDTPVLDALQFKEKDVCCIFQAGQA